MSLVDRRQQVGEGDALEVTAARDDTGGGLLRPVAVGRHGDQARDGLAVARDGEALAARDAVEQAGEVPSSIKGLSRLQAGLYDEAERAATARTSLLDARGSFQARVTRACATLHLRAQDPAGLRDSGAGDIPLERGPGMN